MSADDHDHDDGHPHGAATAHRDPPRPDLDDTLTYYRAMEIGLRELLIERASSPPMRCAGRSRTWTAAARRKARASSPKRGSIPTYKKLLLRDGGEACVAAGLDRGPYKLVVVENTPDTHNVIVCTLCSCYPRWLLGLPPDWYKSRAYRSRVVREPRAVLAEFGTEIPDDVAVRVHDTTADMRYLGCRSARPAPKDGARSGSPGWCRATP